MTVALAVLGCGTVNAQQAAAPTGENTLTEIIVTAQKRPELLMDVPVAVTVVTGTQLADEHIYSIADLVRTTPEAARRLKLAPADCLVFEDS